MLALAGCGAPAGTTSSDKVGQVSLTAGGAAAAIFYDRTHEVATFVCTTTASGACKVTLCRSTMPDAALAPPVRASAGLITVDGELMPLVLTPGGGGSYDASGGGGWNGGERLDVKATGSEVPAFATTLTAPRSGTVDSPPQMDHMSISRSQDYTISWTPQGADRFRFTVRGLDNNSAACTFPAAARSAAIPASVLAQLPPDNVSLQGDFVDETELSTGGWSITVTAQNNVYHADFNTLF